MAYTYTPYQERKYQQSDAVNQAYQNLQQHQTNAPGEYKSQYKPQLDNLLNQYQNRGPFSYDINADALYQQAAQRYMQMGQQAMMDTMGQASALTGGYGNSYAQTAGQQTYQGYLQGINDMAPQYYQMALDRYQMEGNDLLNRYNMMATAEDQEYGRYMDAVNQYYSQLDRLQSAYESERNFDYGQFESDRNFDYGKYQDEANWGYRADRDDVEDTRWGMQWQQTLDEWDYQKERDRISDEQWQQEMDERIRQFNESQRLQREIAAAQAAARSAAAPAGDNRNYIQKAQYIYDTLGTEAAQQYMSQYYQENNITDDRPKKRGQQ